MKQGVYRVPAVHFRGHAVLANTAPTAVFLANDTDRVSVGGGSHSDRSMRLASIAIAVRLSGWRRGDRQVR